MTTPDHHPAPADISGWNFTAALAAWMLPGFGHYLVGQRRRGGILAASIGVLFVAGFIIGGIGTFDRAQMAGSIVQFGQYGLGPSIVFHYGHQLLDARDRARSDGEPPVYEPAFGRVQEQAVLYTSLAGMLNLLAILDVMYRDPRRPRLTPNGDLAPPAA